MPSPIPNGLLPAKSYTMVSMRRIRQVLVATLMLSAGNQGLAAAGAELIWPEDARARRVEAQGTSGAFPFPVSWPVSAGELCRKDSATWLEACREADGRTFRATLALGSYGIRPARPTGSPFETFQPGWGSLRTDPELARAWSSLPPAIQLELRHSFSPRAFAYFRLGLRRDLAAWRQDDLGMNVPTLTREVDLNEPSLGYLNWNGDWLDLTVGRFPVHWSPSPEHGLTLSHAVPYHNAAQAVLKGARLKYRFLVASLNPWLEGTPPGDTSGTDYPVGSEQWRQRNYPKRPGSENAHNRVYDAPNKSLIAHRLETEWGPAVFGITETMVVGGKPPDLREMNPFAVFHNDFHEGYSNNNVALDASVRLPYGFSSGAELFMDDLEWSETEGEGATPSLLGYLAMIRHVFPAGKWDVVQSLHAVRTEPYLYGFLQPLNTYSSRHVLTSNHDGLDGGILVDKFVVDYPLGYLRGGDAFDFWYRIEAHRGTGLSLAAACALLARGPAGLSASYEGMFASGGSSPSGTAERELRIAAEGEWRWAHGFSFGAAAGLNRYRNAGHVEGRSRTHLRLSLGAAWSPHP